MYPFTSGTMLISDCIYVCICVFAVHGSRVRLFQPDEYSTPYFVISSRRNLFPSNSRSLLRSQEPCNIKFSYCRPSKRQLSFSNLISGDSYALMGCESSLPKSFVSRLMLKELRYWLIFHYHARSFCLKDVGVLKNTLKLI